MALVVGNSAYQHTAPLDNPSNDAEDMARQLRQLGFQVIEGRDLTWDGFYDHIRLFSEAVRRAKRGEAALFFYAGHGIQNDESENFLVPVDVALKDRWSIPKMVRLDHVMEAMEEFSGLKLVFLDACRDNPLRGKGRTTGGGGRRGLAPVSISNDAAKGESSVSGTVIVYATAPDDTADDGEGRNSPFTGALLEHIGTPGLEVGEMLDRVTGSVIERTRHTETPQVPWQSRSKVGQFFFVPGSGDNDDDSSSATVALRTIPENAHVRIAGEQYRRNMSLDPGTYEVVVEAEGYESVARKLDLPSGFTEFRIALCRLDSRTERICEHTNKTVYRTEERTDTLTIEDYHKYTFSDYEQAQIQRSFYTRPYATAVRNLNRAYCEGDRRNSPPWRLKRILRSDCEDQDGRLRRNTYDIDCECGEWGCVAEGTVECEVTREVEVPEIVRQEACRDEPRVDRVCPDQIVTRLP